MKTPNNDDCLRDLGIDELERRGAAVDAVGTDRVVVVRSLPFDGQKTVHGVAPFQELLRLS